MFVNVYRYFVAHRAVFWIVFTGLVLLMTLGASRIRIEEDISKIFPQNKQVEELNYVFRNARFADRLILMVSMRDSSTDRQPDSLIFHAEALVEAIQEDLKQYIAVINLQVDDSRTSELIGSVYQHLPIFLEEQDYHDLDSILQPTVIRETIARSYRQLISPSGMVTKDIILHDPLGFSFIPLKKLQRLQYEKNFVLYDNYVFSRDYRHLLVFIEPLFPANETRNNSPLIEGLNSIVKRFSETHPRIMASHFGASAVAVENARQIRKDIHLTLGLMVVLLAIFLLSYFRKKRIPFLILVPVLFGGSFSLCCVYILQGSISILALAAGSIILGIAVNYALHFLVHLKNTQDTESVVRDLVKPLTLGSVTTVLAFFCLQFVNASVLRDLGLFAGFSLIGAALCSLIFLPHFVAADIFKGKLHQESWLERLIGRSYGQSKYTMLVIVVVTGIFLFYAPGVSFNTDMGKLNFLTEELRTSQNRLETLSAESLTAAYVVSHGSDLQEALRKNEQTSVLLGKLASRQVLLGYSSVSPFISSDSLQQLRIDRWRKFWDEAKYKRVVETMKEEGRKYKFSPQVFQNFSTLVHKKYVPKGDDVFGLFRETLFEDYIIEKEGKSTIIQVVAIKPANRTELYTALEHTPAVGFDRQMLTNSFVEYVYADFNLIVTITSVMVFLALLISYGRIEITLITFIPMLITWIWILGIMAITGLEFNIVNVMISTFIFGLGDDYSIFTMDGLKQKYQYGKENISSVRSSIFLSALTTITGLGVLIFAGHPALRSIAAIAIIGIICVFMMSQTVEPFLFRWMITRRTEKGLAPMTLLGMSKSVFMYFAFALGSFLLTVVGFLLRLVPFGRNRLRLFFHYLISRYTGLNLFLEFGLKKSVQNKDPKIFSRSSVIICNHTSFLDILFTTMQHPKLILLTNKWVWNSRIFGGVVRLADYYPVMEGVEDSVDQLKERVKEGYSVVVFPEGTRSADGKIQRFHKGAFYIAEAFDIPIQPLLIHGAHEAIPKNTMYINDGYVTLKYLPPIFPEDDSFGTGYSERAKKISRYFKEAFQKFSREAETPIYFQYRLINNYLYKGPVLEWYLRIKLRLENYYAPFNKLISPTARVLDLGCGYGFLDYMLHFLSPERTITGVDYDEEKIETANNCYSKTSQLRFVCSEVQKFRMERYDAIIIADVLHYLTPRDQELLLIKSMHALNPGGKLIVREGNADMQKRHRGTKLTELFSVKLLKFNKAVNGLSFVSGRRIAEIAETHGFCVRTVDQAKYTSNVIFVIE